VIVLFGARPELIGWQTVDVGHPNPALLDRVRQLSA
jgi:hypothetical protein